MLLTFLRLSTKTHSPAETRGVQLIHWLPLSVGLAVCLLVTHKWVSFVAAWCISDIFHPRNILPAPRWWDVVLDGGSSSHSSWESTPCRSGRIADVPHKECNLFTLHQCLLTRNTADNASVSAETYLISATSVGLLFLCHHHNNWLFYRTTKPQKFLSMALLFFDCPVIWVLKLWSQGSPLPHPWFFLPASSSLHWAACCVHVWGQVQCPLPVLVAQENVTLPFLIARPKFIILVILYVHLFFQAILFLSRVQINCFFDNKIKNQ